MAERGAAALTCGVKNRALSKELGLGSFACSVLINLNSRGDGAHLKLMIHSGAGPRITQLDYLH